MPTVRQMYKQMQRIEKIDHSEGLYPVMFKNEWQRFKFIRYVAFRNFMKKVRQFCHL